MQTQFDLECYQERVHLQAVKIQMFGRHNSFWIFKNSVAIVY